MKYLIAIAFIIIITPSLSQKKVVNAANTSEHKADSLFALGEWSSAIYIYTLLKKEKEVHSRIWFTSGSCYQNLREYEKALADWNTYLQIKPKPDSSIAQNLYSGLAKIYASKINVKNGFKYLKMAADLGYSRLDEMDYDPDFNSLRPSTKFSELRKQIELNAYPCLSDPRTHEFDFWIGDWDVYTTGTGNLGGFNSIQRAAGGCMLLENWTAVGQPHNGKSMNYFDPMRSNWEQLWIGSEGGKQVVHRFINGTYDVENKVMKFEFFRKTRNGRDLVGRFQFFNQGPDQVRQLNEASVDGGKTWFVNYDYTYIRRK